MAPPEQQRPDSPPAPLPWGPSWRKRTLFLVTAAGVIACLLMTRTLLFAITGSIAFAVALRVPYRWLRHKLSPAWSATLLVAALILAVLLPGFFVGRSLVSEVQGAVTDVINGTLVASLQSFAARHPKLGGYVNSGIAHLPIQQITENAARQAAVLFGRGLTAVGGALTQIVLMLFLLFFVLRDQDEAIALLRRLLPLHSNSKGEFLSRLSDVTYAILVGRFLIAAAQGVLAGLAYWLLGVPGPVLWTAVTAVACLIPAFGAFLVWIPVALYLGLAASWTKALILAVWGGVVVSNIDNVLYPMLVGGRTGLHTAVIFVAIFGGVALFGLPGFVIGPVIVAATQLLLESWRKDPSAT